MFLKKYQQKREFSKTPEPKGSSKSYALSHKQIFVIHDHYARQHHHDLRLERDNVLKSWALPKLTPEKGEKHLAIQVEDHPLEYAKFTGKIPEGEYGAGEVKIFDRGTYEIIHQTDKTIEFELFGKKLSGIWALVQLKDKKNWLFFKTSKKSGGANA